MKKYKNKINRHVPGLVLIIAVGVLVPRWMQLQYQSLIQILLVVALAYSYVYVAFIYEKKSGVDDQLTASHTQGRMVESQKIMLELSNSMIQVKSFEELLSIILGKAIEMIPTASHGSILVMNKDGMLEFKAILGFDEELYHVKLEPEESYQWRATGGVFNGPIIIEDLLKYTHDFMSEDNYETMNEMEALSLKSSLSAPIMINNRFFGSINIDSKVNNMFNDEDVQLMSYFANQATIAIVNHQLYDKMLYFSRYDGLTQIYNRRYFEEIIEGHLTEKPSTIFSIVLIDLNRFKQINDLYGHRNGDLVLERFADLFGKEVANYDVFARYGGDEFVCVFYNNDYTQTNDEMSKVRQLSATSSIELIDTVACIKCEFSYGIATYPHDGKNLNELLHIADGRMYESKKSNNRRREDRQ